MKRKTGAAAKADSHAARAEKFLAIANRMVERSTGFDTQDFILEVHRLEELARYEAREATRWRLIAAQAMEEVT